MVEHGTEVGASSVPGHGVALEGGSGPEPCIFTPGALTSALVRAGKSQE